MPWIGLYVAGASLICSLAMAADVFLGFRNKKLWFPCKYFTLNAASLTLLAVAMKLAVDLSTDMIGLSDQLAKLTGIFFMCMVMCNFMPSLGQMSNKDIIMNITALGILVVTILVNLCIEISIGTISPFLNPPLMLMMLVLFVIMSSSTLYVPSTRKYIDLRYREIHQTNSSEIRNFNADKLREVVRKYWIMAQTGSPQFVMARSVMCAASGAICVMLALFLASIEIVAYYSGITTTILDYSWVYDWYSSDYKWSIPVILVVQTIGIGVGTIACAFRLFTTIRLKCSRLSRTSFKTEFRTENYWIERLVDWKDKPLPLNIRGRTCKKLVHNTKDMILSLCIKIQIVIVVVCKLIQLLFILSISPLWLCYRICKQLVTKLVPSSCALSECSGLGLETTRELDLGHHVLLLEGENELPERMLNHMSKAVNRLIQNGRKQHPENLVEFLNKSTDFKGLAEFDSEEVPSLDSIELPNSWMMSVVTLTSIAIAIPNIEVQIVKQMLRSVNEGLIYTRLVEKNLNEKGDLVNIINAAEVIWPEVELYGKWLDNDLRKIAFKENNSMGILERLAVLAKNSFLEYLGKANEIQKKPLNWPVKVVAANSMYRITRTLLMGNELGSEHTNEELFEKLSVMISGILAACLTNLPRVITAKCFCSAAEKREESVQQAAHLLGETEEILKIIQQRELPSLNQDQTIYIDEWRATIKQEYNFTSHSSSNNNTTSFGSNETHISIE